MWKKYLAEACTQNHLCIPLVDHCSTTPRIWNQYLRQRNSTITMREIPVDRQTSHERHICAREPRALSLGYVMLRSEGRRARRGNARVRLGHLMWDARFSYTDQHGQPAIGVRVRTQSRSSCECRDMRFATQRSRPRYRASSPRRWAAVCRRVPPWTGRASQLQAAVVVDRPRYRYFLAGTECKFATMTRKVKH